MIKNKDPLLSPKNHVRFYCNLENSRSEIKKFLKEFGYTDIAFACIDNDAAYVIPEVNYDIIDELENHTLHNKGLFSVEYFNPTTKILSKTILIENGHIKDKISFEFEPIKPVLFEPSSEIKPVLFEPSSAEKHKSGLKEKNGGVLGRIREKFNKKPQENKSVNIEESPTSHQQKEQKPIISQVNAQKKRLNLKFNNDNKENPFPVIKEISHEPSKNVTVSYKKKHKI